MEGQKDITFIFLLFNTSGFTSLQEDFNGKIETQLTSSQYNPNINILIIYTTFFNIPKKFGMHTFGTRLIELEKDTTGSTNWEKKTVANFGNINIGNQDTLGLIFTYIKAHYKSNDYIVYSNNHSNQFGALNENINNIRKTFISLDTKMEFVKNFQDPPDPFIDYKYDIEIKPKIDMLTYNEFSKAFSNGFMKNLHTENLPENVKLEKVTLLVLVSCYSSTIDNIINFSESVKYLCVAEGEIFYNFINVTKFLEYFTDKSIPNIEEKIEKLFSEINADYPEMPNFKNNKIALTEFGCFKLHEDSLITEAVNNLNALIKYALSSFVVLDRIKTNGYKREDDIAYITRADEAATFPTKNSLDVLHFINNISDPKDTVFTNLIDAFKYSLSKICLTKYKNASDRSGLSCFFPQILLRELDERQFEYMAATYSVYSSQANEFSKKTLWPELLQAIEKIEIYKP